MSEYVDYVIEIADFYDTVDLTERAMGFSVSYSVGIGERGQSSCTVTFDNNDGAFTPAEGGGNGLYRLIDWYSKRLRVLNNAASPDPALGVFSGVIKDIRIDDDGVNSTVTMTAFDWLSASTSVPEDTTVSVSEYLVDAGINAALDGVDGLGNGLVLPKFGNDSAIQDPVAFSVGSSVQPTMKTFVLENVTTHDIISTMMLPAGPTVHFPAGIGFFTSPQDLVSFQSVIIDSSLNRLELISGFGVDVFKLSESPSGSGLSAVFPFRDLQVGYSTELLTTDATIGSGNFTPPKTSTNADAAARYGSHSRVYQDTAHFVESEAQATADFWTERGGSVKYAPQSVKVTDLMVKSALGVDGVRLFRRFLAFVCLPFARVDVTYTPVGGVQVSVPTVVKSYRIDATPVETVVTLRLLPAVDWQSFTLDDSLMGVLGGTFETYEDPDVLYDEPDELYDGLQISGNRLG